MLAPVHARSNAPRDAVVGRPIFAFAQSACVRNAVAAMKRSGRTAETQKSPIATTSGHEFAAHPPAPPAHGRGGRGDLGLRHSALVLCASECGSGTRPIANTIKTSVTPIAAAYPMFWFVNAWW